MNEKLILGIHLIGHDLSMSLLDPNGEIIFIAEEERYSNIKGGNFIFSPTLIKNVFSEYKISLDNVHHIAIVGEPEKWPSNTLKNLSYNPKSRFKHKTLWENEILALFKNVDKIIQINHHLAHAACAYYSSDFSDACIITMDAYGDNETATIYEGKNNSLKKLFSIPFYHSHVYLYEAFAIWLNLHGKEKAGKLMGLSSYGEPKYVDLINSLFKEGSIFRLSDIFENHIAKAEHWVNIIEEKIGERKKDHSEFNQFQKDIASSIQNYFETVTNKIVEKGRQLVASENICCAGGGFYNSVSNGKLLKSNIFSHYYFHPIAGDSGLSLGAAQLLSRRLGYKRANLKNVFLGSNIKLNHIENIRSVGQYKIQQYTNMEDLLQNIAFNISNGKIIGWCQSRMEVGPRALGNRSVLADARDSTNIKRLNKIKKRESWRPFASSVLEEDVSCFFDIKGTHPFMNVVAKVIKPNQIPASCHIDGTARIQTVNQKSNSLYYELIKQFKEITGIGVLLNTSLNVQGKPIARNIQDCFDFFNSGQVDIMVIGNCTITISENIKNDIIEPNNKTLINTLPYLETKYNILCLSPNNVAKSLYDTFHIKANQSKYINNLLAIGLEYNNTLLSEAIDFDQSQQLVILLPWYIEVIQDMLPNLYRELGKIYKKYSNCLIIDIEGKIAFEYLSSNLDFEFNHKNETSEVEDHFINNCC